MQIAMARGGRGWSGSSSRGRAAIGAHRRAAYTIPMIPRRQPIGTLLGLAALACAACEGDSTGSEDQAAPEDALADGGHGAEGAPEQIAVELVPATELAALAQTIRQAAASDALLCPGYAEPASDVLRAFAVSADETSEDVATSASLDIVHSFASDAALTADALTGLRPTDHRAARRHTELEAALRDLADGFSSLGEDLDRGGGAAAEASLSRTKNGLTNVADATEAVLAACR